MRAIVNANCQVRALGIYSRRLHLLFINLEVNVTAIIGSALVFVWPRGRRFTSARPAFRPRSGDHIAASNHSSSGTEASTPGRLRKNPSNRWPRPNVFPPRIHIPHRVLQRIPINTRSIHKPQRVGLDIPPGRWIVVPHPVLVEAGFALVPLTGKAEGDVGTGRGMHPT